MTTTVTKPQQQPIRSTIPARLDRLRWSPFHTRLVLGLGAFAVGNLAMTVLVGIPRSADSRAAIRLAAREARYRNAPLIAVMAYPAQRGWSPATRPGIERLTPADDRAVAEALLREAVNDALGDEANGVQYRAVADAPGRALVHAARTTNAQLIVLATRHGVARALGAVSQYVLLNASCPVLAVPQASTSP